jgi:hypothetical protein
MHLQACKLLVILALLGSSTFAQGPAFQSPVGQETWAVNSDHVIRWNPVHIGDNARLKAELSVDNRKTWSAIKTPYIDAVGGSFRWKITGSLSEECFIRVINTKTKVSIQNHFPFAIIPSQEVPNYQWTRLLEKTPYAPRDGAGILSFNDKIFIFGGWNPGDKKNFPRICNNEVWSSTDGKKWQLIKPNTFLDNSFDADADWEGRHTGGYVIHNDKMWLVGGDVNQGHYQNDVWNSSDGKHWTRVTNNVPWGPRALHSTVAYQEKIWIIGGQTMPAFAESKEAFFSDVWNSSDGVTWQRIVPKKPAWKPRGMISGSVVFKGRIWLLGGGTYDTPTTKARNYYNDVWSTADGESWQRHTESAPWQPRQYQHVAVYENRIWVIGGYHDGDINDVWYSADGENWYRVFGTPWQSRHATSVVAHNGKLWLTLGSCMVPDLWYLKRSDDPGYKAPVEPPLTSLVSIKLDGFTKRKVFIFDSKNPNGSPFGFTTFPNRRVHRPIYSTTFGLNYLDGVGKNAYAEMMITEQGDIEFIKWRDGGANNHIAVDNTTRPPYITITQK